MLYTLLMKDRISDQEVFKRMVNDVDYILYLLGRCSDSELSLLGEDIDHLQKRVDNMKIRVDNYKEVYLKKGDF